MMERKDDETLRQERNRPQNTHDFHMSSADFCLLLEGNIAPLLHLNSQITRPSNRPSNRYAT